MPKLQTLKPRIQMLEPMKARGIKTLKQKQEANGRTLALNGAAWRKLRARVLNEQPLCPECREQGLLVSATEVDHVDNDPSNNERSNLMGLCKAHHSAKTNRDMGRCVNYGCDGDGMPLDPNHPWNREKSSATDSSEPTASPRINANRKN